MSNVLITGGAGFIGSSLAAALGSNGGHNVTVVDNLSTGQRCNLIDHENIEFIKCDVNRFDDISTVFFSRSFDYIFHYAAVVGVHRTLECPIDVLEDISGIKNILNLARSTRVKRVFYASSSEVYGEPVSIPQHEYLTPLNSRLPYAVVKNLGEAYFRSFHKEFGLEFTIFRFFNTYGPTQSSDFVVSRFLRAALRGDDLAIYGDGSQTRTFCYIDDNVDVTTRLMLEGSRAADTVNIGSNVEVSVLTLAETIIKLTGSKSQIVFLPPLPEGDMTRRQPDNTEMMRVLGRPLISLENGLKKMIYLYRNS